MLKIMMERWTREHKKIQRQLVKFKWSMEELRWWEKQSKGWPIGLAQLLAAMIHEAQQQGATAVTCAVDERAGMGHAIDAYDTSGTPGGAPVPIATDDHRAGNV